MITINVKKGDYIIKVLMREGVPFSVVQKCLRVGDIKINGSRVRENVKVNLGDEVVIYAALPVPYDIVYEDDNVLIVNKHMGVATVDAGGLEEILQKNYEGIKIKACHRIDTNTTGLVIFAKNISSYDEVLGALLQDKISKFYMCVIAGKPPKKQDVLNGFLIKNEEKAYVKIFDSIKDIEKLAKNIGNKNTKISTKNCNYAAKNDLEGFDFGNAKTVTTAYKTLDSALIKLNTKCTDFSNLSLLEVMLKTGRTHQIRAHLTHINCPVLGDEKYGNKAVNDKFNLHKQLLCAYKLKFDFSGALSYLNEKTYEVKPYFIK